MRLLPFYRRLGYERKYESLYCESWNEANALPRDYVYFFGYVQLGAKERAYSSSNSGNAEKLAEINGMNISFSF